MRQARGLCVGCGQECAPNTPHPWPTYECAYLCPACVVALGVGIARLIPIVRQKPLEVVVEAPHNPRTDRPQNPGWSEPTGTGRGHR